MTAANVIPFRSVQTLDFATFDPLKTREMPDDLAAFGLDKAIRELEALYKRGFVLRGLICLEVKRRALWRFVSDYEGPYHSFEDWVTKACPHSRSDCFAAMKAAEDLADIPVEELAGISGVNIRVLQSLSSSVRTRPEVLEAAQNLPEKQFVAHVAEHFPDMHITAREDSWDEAVKLCCAMEGCGRIQAKECIAMFYISHHMGE